MTQEELEQEILRLTEELNTTKTELDTERTQHITTKALLDESRSNNQKLISLIKYEEPAKPKESEEEELDYAARIAKHIEEVYK